MTLKHFFCLCEYVNILIDFVLFFWHRLCLTKRQWWNYGNYLKLTACFLFWISEIITVSTTNYLNQLTKTNFQIILHEKCVLQSKQITLRANYSLYEKKMFFFFIQISKQSLWKTRRLKHEKNTACQSKPLNFEKAKTKLNESDETADWKFRVSLHFFFTLRLFLLPLRLFRCSLCAKNTRPYTCTPLISTDTDR